MDTALRYLEKAFVEETATRLRSEGYEAESLAGTSDIGLDLVASKGYCRIAVQVKARPSLKESAKEIGRTRDAARGRGFDEYRLVVVNPPHDREVSIEGLDGELRRWIESHPESLAAVASRVVVLEVIGIDLHSVDVSKDHVRVAGVGAILEECREEGPDLGEKRAWTTDFPVSFDVVLTHDLVIEDVEKLEVDFSNLED